MVLYVIIIIIWQYYCHHSNIGVIHCTLYTISFGDSSNVVILYCSLSTVLLIVHQVSNSRLLAITKLACVTISWHLGLFIILNSSMPRLRIWIIWDEAYYPHFSCCLEGYCIFYIWWEERKWLHFVKPKAKWASNEINMRYQHPYRTLMQKL